MTRSPSGLSQVESRPLPITYRGPSELAKTPIRRVGFGDPPSGFVTPTTSADEWAVYWGLGRIFLDPDEAQIRNPPFYGGLDWGYQLGDRQLGSAVVDFEVYLPGETIGIRVQTPFFHGELGPAKNAYDDAQAAALSRWMSIRDVYSQDFIEDASGESVITVLIETLGGRERLPQGVRLRRSTYRRK